MNSPYPFDLTCLHSLRTLVLLQPILWYQLWVGFNQFCTGTTPRCLASYPWYVHLTFCPGAFILHWNVILWDPLAAYMWRDIFRDGRWELVNTVFSLPPPALAVLRWSSSFELSYDSPWGLRNQLHLIPSGAQILPWDLLSGKPRLRYHISNIWEWSSLRYRKSKDLKSRDLGSGLVSAIC